jgi:hypothetical protein
MEEGSIGCANPKQPSEFGFVHANHTIRDPFNPDNSEEAWIKLAEAECIIELVKESPVRTAFPPEEGTYEIPECHRGVLPWLWKESKRLRVKNQVCVIACRLEFRV